jgi:tetratricopeptide (TPR) repeat protein
VNQKARTWLICLALATGTALLYAPVLHFSYVALDDQLYFDNHILQGFSWAGLRWCFATTLGSMWHPLTWVSHMLDFQFFGALFGGHHATNVALHILSSVMLFLLLRRMTGAMWRSAMVAALFAWHPLHVESVAWLAERKDGLSAFFWMLTIWAYIRYVEENTKNIHGLHRSSSPNPNPSSSVPSVKSVRTLGAPPDIVLDVKSGSSAAFYILALLFFALGLMAKPVLVTMPFVLLLLDWWPLGRMRGMQSDEWRMQNANRGREGSDAVPFWGLVREKIPFCLLSIVFSVLTLAASARNAAPLAMLPLTLRLGNCAVSYFLYVAKTVWPENMVVLYPFVPQWPAWRIGAASLFVVVVSATALRLWRSRPYFLLGWLWYLGILVPVIGLVQVGVEHMADRYSYIPSIGLFVIFCWGASDLLGGWRHGKMILGGLAWAVLLGCALVAENQLQYWRNSDTLFIHNLEVAPNSYVAHAAYAAYFYNNRQVEKAAAESQKSILIKPGYPFSHTVLGECLLQQGKPDQAAAQFQIALQAQPAAEDARLGYGNALLVQNLPAQAARQFTTVLAANPDNPEAHFLMGQALLKQGDLSGARAQYSKAMSLVKRYSDAQFQLAVVLARQGNIQEAVKNYRAAKSVPQGVEDFLVLNNLAWILAASPLPEYRDGSKAVELATRARDLDHSRHPLVIGTLAAAYAEAGRFDEAVAAARQAHDLALAQGDQTVAARNLALLEIYRSHHAYHER